MNLIIRVAEFHQLVVYRMNYLFSIGIYRLETSMASECHPIVRQKLDISSTSEVRIAIRLKNITVETRCTKTRYPDIIVFLVGEFCR